MPSSSSPPHHQGQRQTFWSNPIFADAFKGRRPCYFNTGVMVIDLWKWREGRYTEMLEGWMRDQKRYRIYELGLLPPFLLVFAGDVEGVEHRWNQHGLGGDNLQGLCRDLHPGPRFAIRGKCKPFPPPPRSRPQSTQAPKLSRVRCKN